MIDINTLIDLFLEGGLAPKNIPATLAQQHKQGNDGITSGALNTYRQAFAKLENPREEILPLWNALVAGEDVSPVSASASKALRLYIKNGYVTNKNAEPVEVKPKEVVLKLKVPELDSSFANGNNWDYDMLYDAFAAVNITKEGMQAALKNTHIKDLLEPKEALREVNIPTVETFLTYKRQEWVYPTKQNFPDNRKRKFKQAAFHLALIKTSVMEEGNPQNQWYVNPNLRTNKRTAPFSDYHINRSGELPDFDPEDTPITNEVRKLLKTGLSKRHLTKDGKYNIILIQLELYCYHNVWFKPSAKDLMPKASIK